MRPSFICLIGYNKHAAMRCCKIFKTASLPVPEENQPDDINRSEDENWDWRAEKRQWSGAVTELACFALARMKNKDLIQIIDTKRGSLRYVCIFKDKEK
jgi:hypothetical protein